MPKKPKPAARRVKKTTIAKGVKLKRGEASKLREREGGGSVGKYKKVSKKKFCGPSGGAPEATYPVDTAKRCRAALAYARNAPNPSGIRSCVKRKCKKKLKEYKK